MILLFCCPTTAAEQLVNGVPVAGFAWLQKAEDIPPRADSKNA